VRRIADRSSALPRASSATDSPFRSRADVPLMVPIAASAATFVVRTDLIAQGVALRR
jgi:hypothetical protein